MHRAVLASACRWFDDDDKQSLADLVKEERFGGRDMDRDFAANVMRSKRFKQATEDDVADFDVGIDMYDRNKGRLTQVLGAAPLALFPSRRDHWARRGVRD